MMTGGPGILPPSEHSAIYPGPYAPVQGPGDRGSRGNNPASPTLPTGSGFPGHTLHVGPSVCAGCSQPILDKFVLQLEGHTWHAACLRCHVCNAPLSHFCYSGNSRLLCQDDFFRIFGAICSSCREVIALSAVVRRAHDNVYHQECFRCNMCRRELCTGDEFYLDQDGLLCYREDFMASKDGRAFTSGEVLNSKDYLASLKSLPGIPDVSDSKKRENLLNRKFDENPNPSKAEMETMATMFGMEPATVRLWYRKRRAQGKRKGNNNDIASDDGRTNTVIAPTGGYPLPIVNKARLVDAAPETTSTVNQISNSIHELESPTPYPSALEELCSDEFVPPNIDLRPDQIKNGEIVLFLGGDGRKGQGYPAGNEDCGNQSENRYQTPNQRHVYQKHHLVSSVGGDNSCYTPPQGGFDCLKSPRDKPVLLPEYLRHQHNHQTSLQHRNYDVTATHQTNRLLPVSSYPAATCSSLVASTSSASSPLSGNEISDSNNTTSNINSNNSNFADVNMSGALAPQRHLHQEHREGHQHHQRQQQYMSLFPLTQAKTAVTAQP